MSPSVLTILFGILCAAGLACGAFVYRPRSLPQWSFLTALGLLVFEGLCQMLSLNAVSLEKLLFWQRVAMWPMALLPGSWLVFSLTFARGDAISFLKKWAPALAICGFVPVLLVVWFWRETISGADWTPQAGHWVFQVSLFGKALHAAMIVGAVLVVTNLEWTFRAAVGTSRWKIKYAVIGLALWCGARIYGSSQVVLYSASNVQLIVVNSLALAVACVFLAVSLYRSKLASIDIYPSASALHKSFTVLLAGGYLIAVGLLARGVSAVGGDARFPFKALFLLAALGGLGVLSLSDRVRRATRQFVHTQFKRPLHDYRKVWSDFTQRTVTLLDQRAFAVAVTRLIAESFEALTVTVWQVDEATGKFVFAASTSLQAAEAVETPIAEEIYRELPAMAGHAAQPVDIDRSQEKWCVLLRQSNPIFFPEGGHRLALLLVSGGALVGLLVVGDRVGGAPFLSEDLALLKCLGDQIAAGLRNLRLSEKLVRAKEMEAFQAMSAFLVHDLKNTASALSLTLRNLPVHFENPEFRQDALRTVSRSVDHVNELITRLTSLRQKLELNPSRSDLNEVVAAALQSVGTSPGINVRRYCETLPPLLMDARQIESAIVNLVLNAREAIRDHGEIRIETGRLNGGAVLAVTDDGCGMSQEFITSSLFRPFKTSKKNGLGIGMFQTKTIIEAHGGRIAVSSELGKGSTFQVWLPLSPAAEPKPS